MDRRDWHIYTGKIPYSRTGAFRVSFESDPGLTRTKANIYGRCLPCIQNLYAQLKNGKHQIRLGSAYHCWKITAVVTGIDECLALLEQDWRPTTPIKYPRNVQSHLDKIKKILYHSNM